MEHHTGPKRGGLTVKTRDDILDEVESYMARSWKVKRIAEQMGVSEPQVYYDMRAVRKRWSEQRAPERSEALNEKLAQYAAIREVAWQGYEKSMQDAERVVEEYGAVVESKKDKGENGRNGNGRPKVFDDIPPNAPEITILPGMKGNRNPQASMDRSLEKLRRIITTEGRVPANTFLETILKTLQAERQLLGLDEAVKLDITSKSLNFDIFALTRQDVDDASDPVEQRIANPGLPERESPTENES